MCLSPGLCPCPAPPRPSCRPSGLDALEGVCLRPTLRAAERWEQRLGHLCTGWQCWATRSLVKASAGRSAPLCTALGLEALLGTHTQEETLFLEKQSVSLGVRLVWPGTGLPLENGRFPWGGGGGVGSPIWLDVWIKNPSAETVASAWALGLTKPQGGFRDRGPWMRAVCRWGPCPGTTLTCGWEQPSEAPGSLGCSTLGSLEPPLGSGFSTAVLLSLEWKKS